MNKTELVKSISSRTAYTETACRNILNLLLDTMAEELNSENDIALHGFGSFSPWHQTSRIGHNPRTGNSCMISPRVSVKFKPGKLLLKKLNNR